MGSTTMTSWELILIYLIYSVYGSGKSSYEKSRMKLKFLLHEYVESNGLSLTRQNTIEKQYPDVQCENDFTGVCTGNKEKLLGVMFEAYKFRLYQVENNIQKYNRIKSFVQITGNKGSKKNDF